MAKGERIISSGFLKGQQAKRVDDAISETPRSAEEIAQLSGESRKRVLSHLRYWLKAGEFYGETEDERFFRDRSKEQPKDHQQ